MSTVTPLPGSPRPEAMQALSQDVQRRALQQQMLTALRCADDAPCTQLGPHAAHHPTVQRIRAAVAAAEGVRS